MNGTSHTLVEVPPGVQCFVGDEARRRRAVESRIVSIFEGWDYEEIIPPLYDYADVFGSDALAPKTYSFIGREGSLLALRPDFTSLLAKIAAGRLSARPAPIRLYYSGEVLRYEPPKAGKQGELYQVGLEHLGGEGPAADLEVLAIAAECLESLGVRDWVLALGHVGLFTGLLEGASLSPERLEELRERVEAKDAAGVAGLLSRAAVPTAVAEAVARLATFAGDVSLLAEAASAFAFSPPAAAAVARLRQVVSALVEAGLETRLALDLGELRGLDYYTGLVFRVYAPGLGLEVGSGGRYDSLLARFGRPMPAVGFMLGLDRLALLLERQGLLPSAASPVAEAVAAVPLGEGLKRARRLRASAARVRFGGGETP
jgi:ATP phosphoribosyltransferase regulatory subunit